MTLCIAWKNRSGISFASDSRLSNNNMIITDSASKIFKINITIKSPRNELDNSEIITYQSNFGLCFTGSYLSGSLIADAMNLFFSNIQAAPNFSDISMDNFSELALNIYSQVSKQLMELNGSDARSEALFSGYCPETFTLKLYKFKWDVEGEISFVKEKIAVSDLPVFIGDTRAKELGVELLNKINNNYSYYHLLEEIIKDREIISVGGDIQTGVFENGDFDIFGILNYHLDETDFPKVKSSFRFRGLEIDFDTENLRSGNINPSITYINPFERRRQSYFNEINRRIDEGDY